MRGSRLSSLTFVSAAFIAVVSQAAIALTPTELAAATPDNATIEQMAKSSVEQTYIDSLRSVVANIRDYQVYCQLFSKKSGTWKDFGGANLYFKQRSLLRAEIKSTDYRNGSIVVKQSDGRIRGKGGGALSLVKMTLSSDSRSIRLPTGFSLAECDFVSLYDALKGELVKGEEMVASKEPVTLAFLAQPVKLLVIRNKSTDDSAHQILHVIYLNPKTKLPLAWSTYKNGESNAFVLFERMDPNKGLADSLFIL